MASPSQSPHLVEDGDESSVSTTATDHDNNTTSVQSTPSLPPKSKKKKNRSTKSSSSTVKNNDNSHLTTAEQELYNSHARQIRQNAMQLLNNAEASPSSNRYYRSYHNDHHGSAIQPSTVLPVNNSNNMTDSGYSHHPRGVEAPSSSSGDLSVSQVASMAFGCIAHCLTESYRAASNYYSTTTQPPMSYNDYRYETVGISGGESGNGVAAVVTNSAANSHIGELSRGGSANAGNRHTVSYQDYNGYQQTMERDGETAAKTAIINKDDGDTISNNNNNQSSGQKSTEQRGMGSNDNDGRVKVKGEYATVSLPSTYQGGK